MASDETLRRWFERGNYCNAYETEDYEAALERDEQTAIKADSEKRAAFTLGFFGSYELDEMGPHEDEYLEAYHSTAGQRCVELGYLDKLEFPKTSDERQKDGTNHAE